MKRTGIRNLRANLAALVSLAGDGERIIISVHGKDVAELGPLGASRGQLHVSELVERGRVIAPKSKEPYSSPNPIEIWSDVRIENLLREIR